MVAALMGLYFGLIYLLWPLIGIFVLVLCMGLWTVQLHLLRRGPVGRGLLWTMGRGFSPTAQLVMGWVLTGLGLAAGVYLLVRS